MEPIALRRISGKLASVIGHADRVAPLRDYCAGLLATEGRKSDEPIAAVTAPSRTSAQHQSCCIRQRVELVGGAAVGQGA
jgi:SRSO17 transposase